jgi:hypothetical protein
VTWGGVWTWKEGVQDQCVSKDLNTLLTALYVLIDDHVVPPRTGRGRRPKLTDSESLCLAVAQVLLGYHRERRWIRHIHKRPAVASHVPLPAETIRLSQTAEERGTVAPQDNHHSRHVLSVLVRRSVCWPRCWGRT